MLREAVADIVHEWQRLRDNIFQKNVEMTTANQTADREVFSEIQQNVGNIDKNESNSSPTLITLIVEVAPSSTPWRSSCQVSSLCKLVVEHKFLYIPPKLKISHQKYFNVTQEEK